MIEVNKLGSIKDFSNSKEFSRIFTDGMEFVKEVSNYLDDVAMKAGVTFDRENHLKFTKSSMILTTSLIQITSWLVVMRSISRDTIEEVDFKHAKFRLNRSIKFESSEDISLPIEFRQYVNSAKKLYRKISAIDKILVEYKGNKLGDANIDSSILYGAKNIQDRLNQVFIK